MTLIDIIDEVLRELGASEDAISSCRAQSLARHVHTKEEHRRVYRDLTDQEIKNYRGLVVLMIAHVVSDPVLFKKLMEDFLERTPKH